MPAADGGHLGAAYFHAANRGKRSIEVDFDSEDGRRIVRKLAARSDILLENFKVGGLKKFGLDYESLKKECPRLIYCSVTGFGQDGPYAARAGYDLMVQGMGGFMSITGSPDGEPTRAGVPIADIFTGVYGVVGILAALNQRERTGEGAHVDVALLDCQVGILANQALSYLTNGEVPQRIGNAHPVIVPYQVFPVSDGFVIIACGNDGQFAKLTSVLGAPQLAQDPRFLTNKDRVVNRPVIVGLLTDLTKACKRDDLLAQLEAVKVPAGPINDLQQIFDDPHMRARGMRIERASAAAKDGVIPGLRTPINFDGVGAAAERPAPQLGEHSDEILREIGEA
jgi:crotonobetainyl-CoA:carnitine CoA-transferase CaiB-like acyl-CoA transferase